MQIPRTIPCKVKLRVTLVEEGISSAGGARLGGPCSKRKRMKDITNYLRFVSRIRYLSPTLIYILARGAPVLLRDHRKPREATQVCLLGYQGEGPERAEHNWDKRWLYAVLDRPAPGARTNHEERGGECYGNRTGTQWLGRRKQGTHCE